MIFFFLILINHGQSWSKYLVLHTYIIYFNFPRKHIMGKITAVWSKENEEIEWNNQSPKKSLKQLHSFDLRRDKGQVEDIVLVCTWCLIHFLPRIKITPQIMKSLLMSTKSTSWNITLQCLTSPLDAVQFTVAAESLLAEMATPFWSVSPACGRSVVMSVQLCVKHCCLPRWWMHLFVAQVRRHPWWDRPTVHHSPAPTFSSPPLLRCYSPPPPFILPFPFQLYMTNGLHMKCALRYLAIFSPTCHELVFTLSTDCFFFLLRLIFAVPGCSSITEGCLIMDLQ